MTCQCEERNDIFGSLVYPQEQSVGYYLLLSMLLLFFVWMKARQKSLENRRCISVKW